MRRLAAFALIPLLALSACGGDDDGDAAKDGERSSHSTDDATDGATDDDGTDDATDVDVSGDQAILDAAVLTLDDMPAGWTAEEPDAEEDTEGKKLIAECMGVDYSEMYDDATPKAESDDFTGPSKEEVSVEVGLSDSEEWVTNVFEIRSDDRFRQCIIEQLETEMESGDQDMEVGQITAEELAMDQIADGTNAFRVTLPITTQGQSLEAVMDYVAVRVGRGQVVLSTLSFGNPLSPEDVTSWATTSADRLQEGLAAS